MRKSPTSGIWISAVCDWDRGVIDVRYQPRLLREGEAFLTHHLNRTERTTGSVPVIAWVVAATVSMEKWIIPGVRPDVFVAHVCNLMEALIVAGWGESVEDVTGWFLEPMAGEWVVDGVYVFDGGEVAVNGGVALVNGVETAIDHELMEFMILNTTYRG